MPVMLKKQLLLCNTLLEMARYMEERGVEGNPSPTGESPLDIALGDSSNRPGITPGLIEYLFSMGFEPCEENLRSI